MTGIIVHMAKTFFLVPQVLARAVIVPWIPTVYDDWFVTWPSMTNDFMQACFSVFATGATSAFVIVVLKVLRVTDETAIAAGLIVSIPVAISIARSWRQNEASRRRRR